MIIRKLRLQRGWSQEQLSQLSGLSIRTIQRIEQGQKAGLESLKSLAAVFEIQVSDLQMEPPMNKEISVTEDEKKALEYVKSIKEFYSHLVTYLFVISGLFVINYFTSPGYWWAVWPALGWGIGIVSHALSAFEVLNIFGPEWEKKQVEKRLGRKL
ncbi:MULTISPECIES: 2TM domain-containing protein [Photobacterium]|uniref:2TM domain-containing protein n=1 Tax=Photobacterium TaxID=657 RepID=UPI0005DF301E|nr:MULTISPECIES: 2TM domain-containing protein [Photobacterium]KJG06558.1 XRE family transcriptional regulator [Photobacterium angustum]PSV34929.1 helix-turn-helix domain-containing protein [Photobacterium sp. GB-27]PSV35463.1 helix-turn-helix domain-containing protein [Photobacterium sp. GB-210]PSV52035.1 helix-turn-helix domain-containing protein [Photobacterium sp. GB-1]PSV91560.1 helix-turn-helix domain-containing protein [Photobacterium angustum]